MIIEVTVSFSYGAYDLSFYKEFALPAAPFYDMWLDDLDLNIQFCNNQYIKTQIGWDVRAQMYKVSVDEHTREPYSPEFVDNCVRLYTKAGWQSIYSNPEKFKATMIELAGLIKNRK